MSERPHPVPALWLAASAGVLALTPFVFLGDLVGASARASLFLQVATLVVTLLAVGFWRALHRTYGPAAAQVGILGIGFAGFVAMTLVSRMAAFPDPVFALPFLFPLWLAVILFLASALTLRLGRASAP